MDMQHKLDMRRKELCLSEGKISALDWVGPVTTILCWGRKNTRNCHSFHFMITSFKAEQYFLRFSRLAASTSFPQGEEPQSIFLYRLNV